MYQKILIGTNNQDKYRELSTLFSDLGIEATSLQQQNCSLDVDETGSSYRENALLKASTYSKTTGLPCISDDTGLEVDILDGEPGLYSARWAGVSGAKRYQANNQKMLAQLRNIPSEKRTARFICVIVMADGDREIFHCEGICHGEIGTEPRGEDGFGYDPLFICKETGKTFAEMGKEKHAISHRGLAMKALKQKLTK